PYTFAGAPHFERNAVPCWWLAHGADNDAEQNKRAWSIKRHQDGLLTLHIADRGWWHGEAITRRVAEADEELASELMLQAMRQIELGADLEQVVQGLITRLERVLNPWPQGPTAPLDSEVL